MSDPASPSPGGPPPPGVVSTPAALIASPPMDAPAPPPSPPPASPPPPPSTPAAPPPLWSIPKSSWRVRLLFITLAIVGVLIVLATWRLPPFRGAVERTEDAYVEGHVTVIAPQISGYVWRVAVEGFMTVRRGDILVEIDPRTLDQEIEQKRAALAARQAALADNRQKLQQTLASVTERDAGIASADARRVKAVADVRRSSALVADGSLSQRENDENVAVAREAAAQVRQARAQRESAMQGVRSVRVNENGLLADVQAASASLRAAVVNRSYSVIRAPQNGAVSEIGAHVGQFAPAGQPLMYLVPVERWIIANFKERQTHAMLPGQRAWITVDGLGGRRIEGHVERISPATSAQFSALKPDNATGNFTKVPQRIPVRIAIELGQADAARIRPGMSVTASVDTSDDQQRDRRERNP